MSCNHLTEYKTKFGLQPYTTVFNFFVKSNPTNGKEHQKVWISCFSCGSEVNRIFACLHCIYFGCFEDHVVQHQIEKGHKIFVELSNGSIYCCICKDYVYDREYEQIGLQHKERKCKNNSFFDKWIPTETDEEILRQHKDCISIVPDNTIGMRGMLNLGNTCFMNSIMQALLHTPVLRDYFFTDKHVCHASKPSDCLVCHFSRLFQKYYSDDSSMLSLHEILYLIWQNSRHLSGYEQKDAQEFFIAVLDLLHKCSSPNPNNSEHCTCIIDVIFHGKMQSDLVCQSCANTPTKSTKVDPIWDISLDIPDPPAPADLFECLNHYTRPESLEAIECATCNEFHERTKQLTFQTLPIVLVIHLKRFRCDSSGHKKKSTFVPFPVELDMSPFISGQRNNEKENIQADRLNDNQYTLYAVIEHSGTLDTGHYCAYVRQKVNVWYKCNDTSVDPVKIEEVTTSEAYLLFYHKTILSYF